MVARGPDKGKAGLFQSDRCRLDGSARSEGGYFVQTQAGDVADMLLGMAVRDIRITRRQRFYYLNIIFDDIQNGIHPPLRGGGVAAIGIPEGFMKDDFHRDALSEIMNDTFG